MPNDGSHSIVLSDGRAAHVVPHEGGWLLEVGGVRQSHVAAPGRPLALAYARWMMAALGGEEHRRIAQLGGGLLMLARVIAQSRPEATQVVIESEPALVSFVNAHLAPPAGVTLIEGDARDWLSGAPPASQDALLVDVFHDGRIPPAFSSAEFARDARASLTDRGLLVINSVAGPELDFTRRQLAGLRDAFPHVAMIVQGSSLGGLRFGNACLIASGAPIDVAAVRTRLHGDASKGVLVTDIDTIVADAVALTESDSIWSPEPDMPKVAAAIAMVDEMKRTIKSLLPDED